MTDDGNINTRQGEVEEGAAEEVKMKFCGRLFFFFLLPVELT